MSKINIVVKQETKQLPAIHLKNLKVGDMVYGKVNKTDAENHVYLMAYEVLVDLNDPVATWSAKITATNWTFEPGAVMVERASMTVVTDK